MPALIRALLLVPVLSLCCWAQPDDEPSSWFRDIKIPAGQTVHSATCFFCSVIIEGAVSGDVSVQWGDIEVHGLVEGDSVAVAGSIHLSPGAQVHGDAISVFGDTILDDRAQVKDTIVASLGELRRSPASLPAQSETSTGLPLLSRLSPRWRCTVILWLLGLAVALPLAFLSYWLLGRERLERMNELLRTRRLRAILFGSVLFLIYFTAFALGGDSSRSDLLEPFLTVLFLLLLAPGYAAMSLWIGQRFVARPKSAMLLGVVILISLQVVPALGWALSLALMVLSFGAFAILLAQRKHPPLISGTGS